MMERSQKWLRNNLLSSRKVACHWPALLVLLWSILAHVAIRAAQHWGSKNYVHRALLLMKLVVSLTCATAARIMEHFIGAIAINGCITQRTSIVAEWARCGYWIQILCRAPAQLTTRACDYVRCTWSKKDPFKIHLHTLYNAYWATTFPLSWTRRPIVSAAAHESSTIAQSWHFDWHMLETCNASIFVICDNRNEVNY